MPKISPFAVVEKTARLAEDVQVGAFSYIGAEVEIGAGCVIESGATITGRTTLGEKNHVFPMAVIGMAEGTEKPGRCVIGDANAIREHVTIYTRKGQETRLGLDNLVMIGCVVGGGARVANHGIFANCTHINTGAIIEDYVRTSSFTVIEQGATVGAYTMAVGYTGVEHYAPPFSMVQGYPMRVRGVNTENLKRCGFGQDDIRDIKNAFRELFNGGDAPHEEALKRFLGDSNSHVRRLAEAVDRGEARRTGGMTSVTVLREIDPSARISPEARIGAYCVIGPNVTIGPRTELRRRVWVGGHTSIGSGNVFEEGCVLGAKPQDLKYKGTHTLLVIGHGNRFGREVTAHPGTETGGYVTRIGDRNVLADGAHVAHDCYVDNDTRLGRGVLLAGHIRVHDGAVIEDMTGVQHFVTIGKRACVGPRTPIRRDVPPYTSFYSENYDWDAPPAVRGVHEAGIAAAHLGREEEAELRRALRELFDDEFALQTKIEQLVNMGVEGEVAELCLFIQRSLQGVYGRYRELYRGKVPPEAEPHLPPELRTAAGRSLP